MTGVGFRSWGQLLHLTSISIQNGWRVNDEGLETLGCCQAPMRHLNMKGCRLVSDAGLAALVRLSHLTHLSLQVSLQLSRVESALCMGSLFVCMPALMSLCLHSSLQFVCCKKLQGNQGVTDEGMTHLGSMWGLKSLEIQFCWQLTDAGQT